MGLINFIVDVIRKIMIFFLVMIVIVLVIIYNVNYPALHDPNNVMLWIIIAPLAIISVLMKLKRE